MVKKALKHIYVASPWCVEPQTCAAKKRCDCPFVPHPMFRAVGSWVEFKYPTNSYKAKVVKRHDGTASCCKGNCTDGTYVHCGPTHDRKLCHAPNVIRLARGFIVGGGRGICQRSIFYFPCGWSDSGCTALRQRAIVLAPRHPGAPASRRAIVRCSTHHHQCRGKSSRKKRTFSIKNIVGGGCGSISRKQHKCGRRCTAPTQCTSA